jgi:hypothetical protein
MSKPKPMMGISNPAIGVNPAPWRVVAMPGGAGIVDAAGVHVVSTVVTGSQGYWIDPAVASMIVQLVNGVAPGEVPAVPPPPMGSAPP